MSAKFVGSGRSPGSAKGRLFRTGSGPRDDLDVLARLPKEIISRKHNKSHRMRIDRPPTGKLAPITAVEPLAHQLGMGMPYEEIPPS